jgi:hypothetical protein
MRKEGVREFTFRDIYFTHGFMSCKKEKAH